MLDAALGDQGSMHSMPLWIGALFFAWVFYKTIKDGRDEERARLRRLADDERIAAETRKLLGE